jgi:hypothetical protein
MRTYRAKRSTMIFTHAFLGVIVAVCVFGIVYAQPTILYVVFLIFALYRWYQILGVPTEVRVTDDDQVELRSAIGKKTVAIDELTRVKKVGHGIYLEWPEGTANLYGDMEDAAELVGFLREKRPELN